MIPLGSDPIGTILLVLLNLRNMKKARVLIPLIIIAALSACKRNIGPAEESGVIIVEVPLLKESPTNNKPARADIVASIDTIYLDGTVLESLISQARDVKFSRDLIFVMSADAIGIFDSDGRYRCTIKHKGRGPGEYVDLTAFDILEEQRLIYILDNQGQHVIIYDFDGNYVRRIAMECWDAVDFALLPNGHILMMKLMGDPTQRGLYKADENGRNLHPIYQVAPDFQRVTLGFKFLCHINDSVIGCMGLEDTDYIFHYQNDTLTPVYKIKTDIVMPEHVRMRASASEQPNESYTKVQYWETSRYMGLTITNNENFASAMYDKETNQTTRYYMSEFNDSDIELDFEPSFLYCYKNRLIDSYDAGIILQIEPLHESFPEITIDSNPVLIITTLK